MNFRWFVPQCLFCNTQEDAWKGLIFFSTAGCLPRASACRFIDIHTEGRKQQLINSIKWRNSRYAESERKGGGNLPLIFWKDLIKNSSQETCWYADKTNSCIIDNYFCNQKRKHLIYLFITCDYSWWTQHPLEAGNDSLQLSDLQGQDLFPQADGNGHQRPTAEGTPSKGWGLELG